MPYIAKIFRSGNSQAVRLPKDFRFTVDEVEVSREGDAVILRPRVDGAGRWASLRAAVDRGFSDDFLVDGREQPDEHVNGGVKPGHWAEQNPASTAGTQASTGRA